MKRFQHTQDIFQWSGWAEFKYLNSGVKFAETVRAPTCAGGSPVTAQPQVALVIQTKLVDQHTPWCWLIRCFHSTVNENLAEWGTLLLRVRLVLLGSSSWQRFILWGESRSFRNSSEELKDLVGLWRPWSSSETQTIHTSSTDPLRTWCHGSKEGIGQWAELYTVWSLISNLTWSRSAVQVKLPWWFTTTTRERAS